MVKSFLFQGHVLWSVLRTPITCEKFINAPCLKKWKLRHADKNCITSSLLKLTAGRTEALDELLLYCGPTSQCVGEKADPLCGNALQHQEHSVGSVGKMPALKEDVLLRP